MIKKLARNIFYCFIIANLVTIWYFSYVGHPSFSIEAIQVFLAGKNLYLGLFLYMIIMILRGLTVFPGTPLLVLGAVIFPTFHAIIAIEIAVQSYILIIHKYSEVLDFKMPEKIMSYEKKIEKHGIPYIIILCIIPGMSMNILAYVLSILKVPLPTKMIGIGIGSIVNLFIYLHVFKALFLFTT